MTFPTPGPHWPPSSRTRVWGAGDGGFLPTLLPPHQHHVTLSGKAEGCADRLNMQCRRWVLLWLREGSQHNPRGSHRPARSPGLPLSPGRPSSSTLTNDGEPSSSGKEAPPPKACLQSLRHRQDKGLAPGGTLCSLLSRLRLQGREAPLTPPPNTPPNTQLIIYAWAAPSMLPRDPVGVQAVGIPFPYVCTSYWVCFSGEPGLTQVPPTATVGLLFR